MNLSKKAKGLIYLPVGLASLIIALASRGRLPDFAEGFCLGLSIPLLIAGSYFFLATFRSA